MATNSFSADISKFVTKTKIRADLVVKKVAFEALKAIVGRTPVDTGRCRGNWRVSINSVDTTYDYDYAAEGDSLESKGAAAGQKAINAGNSKIVLYKLGETIFITNNLDYSYSLEYGSSKQAPQGMLKITFEELVAYFEKLVKLV